MSLFPMLKVTVTSQYNCFKIS